MGLLFIAVMLCFAVILAVIVVASFGQGVVVDAAKHQIRMNEIERERLEIERDRLALEREKLKLKQAEMVLKYGKPESQRAARPRLLPPPIETTPPLENVNGLIVGVKAGETHIYNRKVIKPD